MRKFNRRFIQIPLLIVIVVSILTVSTGAGTFLYKKGKLPFISKKDNVIQLTQSSNSVSIKESQSSPEIEAKLDELRQKLEYIQNQPVAMNVIEGRKQRAYQDWVNNNPEIFVQIQSSHYASQLNAILTAYGLY